MVTIVGGVATSGDAHIKCHFFFVVCNQDMPLRGPTVSLREGLVGAARKESIGLLSAEVFRGSHALDCTDSWDHAKISLDQQRDVLRP